MDRLPPNPEHQARRELLSFLLAPQPTVVGIEGGPCSGKTTLCTQLAKHENVVVLPEVATEHIEALSRKGIDFAALIEHDRPAYLEVESQILKSIKKSIDDARTYYEGTDTIIVADRCDIGAYVTQAEYDSLLSRVGLAQPPFLSSVDKVLYMPSLAETNPARYSALMHSNPSRYETVDDARAVSSRNLASIARHPELQIVSDEDFSVQLDHAIHDILHPHQEAELRLEPSTDQAVSRFIERSQMLSSSVISQRYMRSDIDYRLRETCTDRGEVLYFFTVKSGKGIVRKELQRILTKDQYDLLKTAPMVGRERVKVRTKYRNGERLWSIDMYEDEGIRPECFVEVDVVDEVDAEMVAREYYEFTPSSRTSFDLAVGR